MRIAVLADQHTVNVHYRALPLLELGSCGHEVVVRTEGERARLEELRTFDVVHIHRYYVDGVYELARRLREAGVAVTWDNDDDLTSAPEHTSSGHRKKGGLRAQEARTLMARMLQCAHVVTTTSAVLARQYREWGAERVHVVENYLPWYFRAEDVRGHEGVTIGWTAAAEHMYDLRALGLREVFKALLEAYPELRFASIGIDLGLARERYRHYGLVQYQELAAHVAQFDVGIAPIADVPFNRARSNVKVKEYAALGVPWLASPIGPYAGMGEKQGGQLVADDAWHEALQRLVRSERERRKLAKRGRKWAAGQTARGNAKKWEAAMVAALQQST